jgi:hypothetical protein
MRLLVQTAWALWLVLAIVAFMGPARTLAQTPAETLEAARQRERALAFDEAEALYEAAAALGEGTRAGRRAAQRKAHLAARRDPDGTFRSLEALEHMRRDDASAARLREFAVEVEAMPDGLVRDDALFLLGEAWFRRRADPARAVGFYERLLVSESLSSSRRRTVGVAIAEARTEMGDREGALESLAEQGLSETFEGRALRADAARRDARLFAVFVLVFATALLVAVGRPWRVRREALSRIGVRQIAAVAYVIGVPALIAELYEASMADVFLYHGAFAVPLLALALAGGLRLRREQKRPSARRLLLASLIVADLAAAWLALDVANGLGVFGFP